MNLFSAVGSRNSNFYENIKLEELRIDTFINYEFFILFMKITVILEPAEEGGFTAYVPSLPGCISEGDTREEALKNIKEALELYIEPDTNELIEFTGEKVALTV